jgi:rhodanese-related sulfurtransferase
MAKKKGANSIKPRRRTVQNTTKNQKPKTKNVAKPLLIDVRTPAEFESQHIKGSHNIPLAELDKHKGEISKINKDVTLICRTGSRAQMACKLLRKEGLKKVEVMTGGIVAYDGEGHRMVFGTQKWDIERQVRFVAGLLVLAGVTLGYLASSHFFLLSGAVALGLIFASITNSCTMGMLLMKLPYNKSSKKTDAKKIINKMKS